MMDYPVIIIRRPIAGAKRYSVIDVADRAPQRLHKKYIRLLMKGKHKNVAVTAVARELTGFVWAVQVSAAA
jgi:hypothetical protein